MYKSHNGSLELKKRMIRKESRTFRIKNAFVLEQESKPLVITKEKGKHIHVFPIVNSRKFYTLNQDNF